MKRLLALALLLSPVPATAATVEVAEGNWSYLPQLKVRGYDHMNDRVVANVYNLARTKECEFPGQSWQRLDMTLSFAAHFNPDGSLNRVVMKRLGCPKAESMLGGMLLEMIQGGDYKPTGENPDGWYRGELSFGGAG